MPPFHFCLTIALFCSMALHAQEQGLKIERFSTTNGLSSNIVYSIFQDSRGFLWIGTNDGLNRYDGYKILQYRFDPGDSNTLASNIIHGILEDANGVIWIGTSEGLCTVDYRLGLVRRIPLSKKMEKGAGIVGWVNSEELMATSSGQVFLYNTRNGKETVLTGKDSSLQYHNANTNITGDKNGNYYFVVNKELANKIYKFDREQRRIIHLKTITRSGIFKELLRSFYCDSRNYQWIEGGNGSVFCHYPAGLSGPDFQLIKPIKEVSSTINCFYETTDGKIWLCTATGLIRYDYADNSYKKVHYTENEMPVITNAIYEDRTGMIWIGSYNGLFRINPGGERFIHLTAKSNSTPVLSGNFILGLNSSSDQRIWINYDWGLGKISLLDLDKRTIAHYPYSHPKFKQYVLDGIRGRSNYNEKESEIWLMKNAGSLNGRPGAVPYFMIFDRKKWLWTIRGDAINSLHDTYFEMKGEVFDIAGWKDEILIATNGDGLYLFNTLDYSFSIHRYNKSEGSISGNSLTCLLVEENGNAWIGTNGAGLNYFDRARKTFTHFTVRDGLCNNSIFSIVKDNRGHLWIGTGNGLSCFDIENKKFRNFFQSDGLINSEFNRYSALKLPDGKILMGGMDGIDWFDPEQVLKEDVAPAVQITDFKVFNKSVPVGSNLSLTYKNNYISIDFAAMDFRNPSANTYAYKLDGIDKDWIQAGNQTSVSYATLSPGRYHFLVKAAGSNGVWSETPAEIYFHIRTPWWRSGFFWGLSAFILVSAMYGVYRFRIKQIKKVYAVRSKISQDLHDEVGATLTSISYLSEVAKLHAATGNGTSASAIDKIGEFSRDMIGEMNDIVWVINPSNDKFEKIESRMRNFASVLLAAKNIQLEFCTDEKISNYQLGMKQRKNLYLIFKEAINNAAKYSGSSQVMVSISKKENRLLMKISDNGTGFSTNGNGSFDGNGLKNMESRAKEILARLTIASAPGKGTNLELSVPLTQHT